MQKLSRHLDAAVHCSFALSYLCGFNQNPLSCKEGGRSMRFHPKAFMLWIVALLSTVALLVFGPVLTASTPVHALTVIRLTDVPGRWFDPPITTIAPGTPVEFQTTTFGGTFTSAIFPCTPASISAGTCSLSNPASFPPGFPFDQPDPIRGAVIVNFTVPGIYVFADKVHPYAAGAIIVSDANHPLSAKQQALLNFVAQNQLFLSQTNWIRYHANQLKAPQMP